MGRAVVRRPQPLEFLILEGAQAGLSWETILRKRTGYRTAFAQFDAPTIAGYDDVDIQRLMADSGIIRNRLKIAAAIKNARAFLTVQSEFGAFDTYVWSFVDGQPRQNAWRLPAEIPATTPEFAGAEQRPPAAWIYLCWTYHMLCIHASDRYGQRPSRRLLPILPGEQAWEPVNNLFITHLRWVMNRFPLSGRHPANLSTSCTATQNMNKQVSG